MLPSIDAQTIETRSFYAKTQYSSSRETRELLNSLTRLQVLLPRKLFIEIDLVRDQSMSKTNFKNSDRSQSARL